MDIEALTCIKGHARFQSGEVAFPLLVGEPSLSHLHPVILVNENSYVLDVGPECLVPTQDE
jgi:hypothetical protein